MSKEKQKKRFVQVFAEDSGFFGQESSLVADRQTGVTYLIIRNTFGSGITPLLDADGKPVIRCRRKRNFWQRQNRRICLPEVYG